MGNDPARPVNGRLDPADRPQSPSHAARKEERGSSQYFFEISSGQICWIAGPVCLNNSATSIRYEALECKNQKKDIIDFAKKRYEVRNYIDGQKDVGDRPGNDELVD